MIVYLAGPLFTQAERRWLRELGGGLSDGGHTVFLPQDDAEPPLLRDPPDFHGAFELCRDAIDSAEVIVAVLDGADADSGTAWECGYAYARNVPIIALRTDFRGGEDQGLNLMLRRSAATVVERAATHEDVEGVVGEVLGALEKLAQR